MPERIDISGSARVLLVHTKELNERLTFSGYHPQEGMARRLVTPGQADEGGGPGSGDPPHKSFK